MCARSFVTKHRGYWAFFGLLLFIVTLAVILSLLQAQPSLSGTSWQLERVIENGESKPPFYVSPTIWFRSATEMTGGDGCSTVSGGYTHTPGNSAFKVNVLTLIGQGCMITELRCENGHCEDTVVADISGQAAQFWAALGKMRRYSRRDNCLYLYTDDNSQVLVFSADNSPNPSSSAPCR